MTERIYYQDPGITEFEAKIISVSRQGDRFHTVLDRSAFYPTSGGQLFDTGMLGGAAIVDVVETPDGDVVHVSVAPVGAVGETVAGQVDPVRRRLHRQQHTAQHILSQVFVELYGYATVSVHLGEEYAAVELKADGVTAEQVRAVEERVIDVIFADYPIEILLLDREEALKLPLRRIPAREGTIRIIRIDDFDYSACGGTHCDSTAQVGLFRIVGREKMRGNPLINFLAGEQARLDYATRYEVTRALSERLTCHFTDLTKSIDRIESEHRNLKSEIARLQKELLPSQAQALVAEATMIGTRGLVVRTVDMGDQKLVGQLAGQVAERINGVAALVAEGRLTLAVAQSSNLHAGNIMKQLAVELGLRGGGGPSQAQAGGVDRGSLDACRAVLERLLRES